MLKIASELGKDLSRFELEALVEHHCELLGTWPTSEPAHRPVRRENTGGK